MRILRILHCICIAARIMSEQAGMYGCINGCSWIAGGEFFSVRPRTLAGAQGVLGTERGKEAPASCMLD